MPKSNESNYQKGCIKNTLFLPYLKNFSGVEMFCKKERYVVNLGILRFRESE